MWFVFNCNGGDRNIDMNDCNDSSPYLWIKIDHNNEN